MLEKKQRLWHFAYLAQLDAAKHYLSLLWEDLEEVRVSAVGMRLIAGQFEDGISCFAWIERLCIQSHQLGNCRMESQSRPSYIGLFWTDMGDKQRKLFSELVFEEMGLNEKTCDVEWAC